MTLAITDLTFADYGTMTAVVSHTKSDENIHNHSLNKSNNKLKALVTKLVDLKCDTPQAFYSITPGNDHP